MTKSCLRGFSVLYPIILHKLLKGDSICFFIIFYSFPLVDVCRLLPIWIQLEITLYVDIIICLYMCSAETQLLIRVGWGFMFADSLFLLLGILNNLNSSPNPYSDF